MSTTPHLALPLLAAAQAQKHVTHNEALASLDALVQLAVKERNRDNPPISPTEGDRYLVGAGGVGVFAGHEGTIALFDLGIWRFFAPRPGWCAYIEAEDTVVFFNGAAWRELAGAAASFERLGVGTQPDAQNPLAVKLNTALFTAQGAAEGGTGDLRVVLNKETSGRALSQLYQSGYSGRAETGLIGNDDFGIRVSPDGTQWRDAMRIDGASGIVSFPRGVANAPGANLLINASFVVNQRAYAGGALSIGAYGYDRWKGGTGGGTVSRLGDGAISLTGAVEQVIEAAHASTLIGAPSFAGCAVTISVEDPSNDLSVTVNGMTETIAAGAGRRGVTISLDAADTGNLAVQLQSGSATTFLRPKLELGESVTPWIGNPLDVEEARCRRYYQRIATCGITPLMMGGFGVRKGLNLIEIPYAIPVPLRANASISSSGFAWAAASPVGNQAAFFDPASGSWLSYAGGFSISTAVPSSPSAIVMRIQAGTSFAGSAGSVGQLYLGHTAYLAVQAEL